MNTSRIFALIVASLSFVAPACSGKDADLACYQWWNVHANGTKVLWRCTCDDWSKTSGPPENGSLVAQCDAGVSKVEGPNPDGYPDSTLVCCQSSSSYELCACVAEEDVAECSGKTLSATCTTAGLGGSTTSGDHCTSEEAHTTYASCTSDADCYSGYCDDTSGKSPYCFSPNDGIRDEGRGYDCASDADCEAVAPDFVARGGTAHCYYMTNVSKHEVCTFNCNAP